MSTGGVSTGTGGSSTGGAEATGGSPSSDGSMGTGGMEGTGGSGTGGSGTGGMEGTGGSGTGGSGTGGSGTGGSGTGGATGGAGEGSGAEHAGGAAGSGQTGCGELSFTPRAATVYVLLDRSSSMSDEGFWEPVRDAVIGSALALQDRIRFGLSAFTGQMGLTCPLELDSTESVQLFNAEAMAQLLDALEPPDPLDTKGETPTSRAVAELREVLAPDAKEGETHLLLITDGNPDFCDDGEAACAADALVYELQQAASSGITTHLFHLAGGSATAARLGNFARAGRGLAAVGNPAAIYAACETEAEWSSLWSALGRAQGQALGTYRLLGPSGSYVTLDAGDPAALEASFASEVADLLSCHVDVTDGELDAEQLSSVVVELGSEILERDAPDGWHLKSSTEIELTGAACAKYRAPDAPPLRFTLDCEGLDPL